MSDSNRTSLHEELEVRVIALLAGELSEAECDELEQILAVNPELSAYRDRMAELVGELHHGRGEIGPSNDEAPRQLSEARRAKIFSDLSVLDAVPKQKPIWVRPAAWGVAASIAMVFSLGILGSIKISQNSFREETVFESPPVAPPAQEESEPEYNVNLKSRTQQQSKPDAHAYRRAPSEDEKALITPASEKLDLPSLDIDVAVDSSSVYGRGNGGFAGGRAGVREMKLDETYDNQKPKRPGSVKLTGRDVEKGYLPTDEVSKEILYSALPKPRLEGTPTYVPEVAVDPFGDASDSSPLSSDGPAMRQVSTPQSPLPAEARSRAIMSSESETEEGLRYNKKSNHAADDEPIGGNVAIADILIQSPKPEKLTAEQPFSTFSLNISDVSFKLAQAALQNSQVPPSDQIRTEEFVNSFDYRDPAPRPDEPVSLSWEMAQHPFEHDRQVVRLTLQTQATGRPSGQPVNLSLLVDNSGSMQRPDRQAILKKSLQALEQKLTPQDNLNVILFARQPRLIAEARDRASQKAAVETALAYRPEGGTNLEAGLMAAYESAKRNYRENGSNRVILLTDGAANLGNVDAGELADYVVEQRKQGIALDAYGVGWDDYNDALLEKITRNGDGRYAFLNSEESAGEDFSEKLAGTLQVAAANVKVQIEWNAERVKRYRQVGYDLHQLKKEDFRDNTVDAAEIAEAESGTALYVLQIDEDPDIIGGLGTLHVRYLDPASGRYEEQSWPLTMPHKIPAANAASPSMRLALTSALFGERLADSPFASGYSMRDLYRLTSGLPEAFPNQPRVAEMQTMILQASELYGEK